jgi:hypothetical protein
MKGAYFLSVTHSTGCGIRFSCMIKNSLGCARVVEGINHPSTGCALTADKKFFPKRDSSNV